MRSLRWVGLVFSLLIVGVMAGLMAPLPSEAIIINTVTPDPPILSITVDASANSNGITTEQIPFDATTGSQVACTSTETTAGYTHCYKITTNGEVAKKYGPTNADPTRNRQFILENADSQEAKLLISETTGLELFTVTGWQLIPVGTWPDSEKVVLTLTMNHKFNIVPHPVTDGSTSFHRVGLRIGGKFTSSPSPRYNSMQMTGTGTFFTNLKNINRAGAGNGNAANTDAVMFFYLAGPTYPTLRFDASQVENYPGFKCDNGRTNNTAIIDPITNAPRTYGSGNAYYAEPKCTPDITLYVKFEVWGPDIVIGDTSPRFGGVNCGTKGDLPCEPRGKKKGADSLITNDFGLALLNEIALAGDSLVAIGCVDENGYNHCNGTIRNRIHVTPAPIPSIPPAPPTDYNTFKFLVAGPQMEPPVLLITTIDADGIGEGVPFTGLLTGPLEPGSIDRIILDRVHETPNDLNSTWDIQNVVCTSLNIHIDTIFETTPVPGQLPEKGPVVVHALGDGDTLDCLWHVKPQTIN